MRKISVVFLVVSILATSAFSVASNDSAYAQNEPEMGSSQLPNIVNGSMPSPTDVPYEPCPTQASDENWLGCSFGIALGSGIGPSEGASARDSGLEPDPAFNYQPPLQEDICFLYQDAFGNACDTSQQQFSDFVQGMNAGYQIGYVYGYMSGYFLDEVFPPQTQPGQQLPTQPGQQLPTQPGQQLPTQPGQQLPTQ
jgi:hypothetical protein